VENDGLAKLTLQNKALMTKTKRGDFTGKLHNSTSIYDECRGEKFNTWLKKEC
jgi:hypothetical protein